MFSSHNQIVPSSLALASVLPSGENTRLLTNSALGNIVPFESYSNSLPEFVCSVRFKSCVPVRTSHNRMLLSRLLLGKVYAICCKRQSVDSVRMSYQS